jgi:hypothetical protein
MRAPVSMRHAIRLTVIAMELTNPRLLRIIIADTINNSKTSNSNNNNNNNNI